tara:strand:- start:1646 stop:2155 length:510 start_codon:yes stop_codon:yes gene_type:complete
MFSNSNTMTNKETQFMNLVVIALLFYSFFLVDFVPSIDTSIIFNPLSRFFILLMMLLASRFNIFIAVLIGFAYTTTKFKMLFSGDKTEKLDLPSKPFISQPFFGKKKDMSQVYEQPEMLTTEENLEDVQSNVVDENAMNTEVKTWSDGYGAQGLSLKPKGEIPEFDNES